MNMRQARNLAKALWGPLGFAKVAPIDKRKLVGKYIVIQNIRGKDIVVSDYYGQSMESWADAFAKARKRLKPQE